MLVYGRLGGLKEKEDRLVAVPSEKALIMKCNDVIFVGTRT